MTHLLFEKDVHEFKVFDYIFGGYNHKKANLQSKYPIKVTQFSITTMIQRNHYLDELVSLQGNGMIKVITGMRRCGKSYCGRIYNEMRVRGFNVDVGVVPTFTKNEEGNRQRANLEVDFVCNLGSRRYYLQSAYRMESEEKLKQEHASLLKVDDSFKKIIVLGEECPVTRDERGITTMSIFDFLLKENSLEL